MLETSSCLTAGQICPTDPQCSQGERLLFSFICSLFLLLFIKKEVLNPPLPARSTDNNVSKCQCECLQK